MVTFNLLKKSQRIQNIFVLLLIISSLLIIYGQILNRGYFLYDDDTLLINHPHLYSNLLDYLTHLFAFETVDLQPIRDLSYWIDYNFLFAGTHSQHYTQMNVFYWGVLCFVSFVYFKKSTGSINKVIFLMALVSTYPLFTWSVSVVAARKHILAVTFCILYLIEEEKELSNFSSSVRKVMYYLLSVFSNPITVFIPLAYKLPKLFNNFKSNLKYFMGWSSLVIFVFGLNYLYYTKVFQAIEHQTLTEAKPTLMLSALGRYWYQIVIPLKFALYYRPGDIRDFIGLALFVISTLLGFKFLERNLFLKYWLLIASILFIPVVRVSHNFISDSYLILPGIIYLAFLVELLFVLGCYIKVKYFYYLSSVLVIAILAIKSYHEVSYTKDPFIFNKISFERELAPKNARGYFYELLKRESEDEIRRVSSLLLQKELVVGLEIEIIILYYSKNYTWQEKVSRLSGMDSRFALIVAQLLKKENNQENVFDDEFNSFRNYLNLYSPETQIFLYHRSRRLKELATKH